jgi:gamma-glutamylcyclotransferase (GGCT)/AIG2-like uncharacterized protein YtfP
MLYFFYGTLKRNYSNFRLIRDRARFVAEAKVFGKMYEGSGIPFLIPDQKYIKKMASLNLTENNQTYYEHSDEINEQVKNALLISTELVHGEIFLVKDDDIETTCRLDSLEGFRDKDDDLYKKFLYPTILNNKLEYVWCYGLLDHSEEIQEVLTYNPEGIYRPHVII